MSTESTNLSAALTALATKVAGEAPEPYNGTVDALSEMVDIINGDEDVPDGYMGIVHAIDTITDNWSGGGGGVDVGAPTFVVKSDSAPEVDGRIPNDGAIAGLAIGDTTIVPVMPNASVLAGASGMTATTAPDFELEPTTCDAYVVTVATGVITASEQWSGTLTPGTYTTALNTYTIWSFTVPALTFDDATFSGQALYLYMQ